MKYLILLFSLLLLFVFIAPCYAETGNPDIIILPNGSELDTSTLTEREVYNAIRIAKKSMESQSNKDGIVESVKNMTPESLDSWRKLITGTIKDVCNDLSITANEFIKTPVGMLTAGMIFYKVAGKDLIESMLTFIIMIPLWIILTSMALFVGWYFFSNKTLYEYKENGNKKIEKVNPKRICRYNWNNSSNKENLGYFLIIFECCITIMTVIIILT